VRWIDEDGVVADTCGQQRLETGRRDGVQWEIICRMSIRVDQICMQVEQPAEFWISERMVCQIVQRINRVEV